MAHHQGHVKVIMVVQALQILVRARTEARKEEKVEMKQLTQREKIYSVIQRCLYLFHRATSAYSCRSGVPFLLSVATVALDMRSGFMP